MKNYEFENREDAGQRLASRLSSLSHNEDTIILGLARGGVMVAYPLALYLHLPWYPLVVKKIGAPKNSELALGAVAHDIVYWNDDLVKHFSLTSQQKKELAQEKAHEVEARETLYSYSLPDLKNKTVLVVDDGVATGATAIAAAMLCKEKKVHKTVLVTPLIAQEKIDDLKKHFDDIVYIINPKDFHAVGEFFHAFSQVDDQEIIKLLEKEKSVL